MDYFAIAKDYGVAEMICPRCKSSDLADFGEGMFRCNRCGALVAVPPIEHKGLPLIDYCDT